MTPPDDDRRDADDHLRPHDGPHHGSHDDPPTPEQTDHPSETTPSYGGPGYGAPGYGAPGYGGPGYGGPGYDGQGYDQQPYPAYGQPPHPGHYAPPGHGGEQHPSATTALVLGIVGLVGIVLCGGLTLLLSPVAWWMGGRAVKEIDAAPGRYRGRDQAQGGRIMGIIGTVLLALGLLAIVLALVVFAVAMPMGSFEGSVSATSAVLR